MSGEVHIPDSAPLPKVQFQGGGEGEGRASDFLLHPLALSAAVNYEDPPLSGIWRLYTFFEYRFPKPADFHFEMKQSSAGSPGSGRLLRSPARPQEPFLKGPARTQIPSAVPSVQVESCFLGSEIIHWENPSIRSV